MARPAGCLWWWVRYLAASALIGVATGHAAHHLTCATTFQRSH